MWLLEAYQHWSLSVQVFISLTVLKTKTFWVAIVTIAAELTLVTQAPFWATWFTVAMGELASLLVGAILIKKLAKVIDFVS